MDPIIVGYSGLILLMILIALGVPIAFAMATVGVLGMSIVAGPAQSMAQLGLIAWDKGVDFVMICIPLFILMGQLVTHAGLAEDLYDCVHKWFGCVPGGLAITSVVACAGFGAVTGVSVAAVATMGTIIMPEMRKYKYDGRLATGCLATAGTLAILIPPSLGMVFYGILTDTSIGALFIAGLLPGILLALGYCLLIYFRCLINPNLGPKGPRYAWNVRLKALRKLSPILIVFIIVMGGIYGGIMTPTEASGIGASGIFIIGLVMKRFTWERMKRALQDTGTITAMVYAIIIAGFLIGRFLVITEISVVLIDFIGNLKMSPYWIMIMFMLMYIILGMILDVYGMKIITLPFVFPIIVELGFDPIWFGVFLTIMAELALVTPPIGVCVYVINNIAPEVPLGKVFVGIIPFCLVAVGMVFLLMAVPEIALWLVYK